MIASENWKQGLKEFMAYIEIAFAKTSLIKRIEFLNELLGMKGETYLEIIKIEKILIFIDYMIHEKKSDSLRMVMIVKRMLPS
jgi:hypothetical protein